MQMHRVSGETPLYMTGKNTSDEHLRDGFSQFDLLGLDATEAIPSGAMGRIEWWSKTNMKTYWFDSQIITLR